MIRPTFLRLIVAAAFVWALAPSRGQASALPVSVSAPKGINLGSTSFFDGFGRTTEGWSWLQYGRYEKLTRITDDQGNTSPRFKGTDIDVYVTQTQISYTSDWHPLGGDGVGISALLPFVAFRSHFSNNSPVKLTDNGAGVGDLSFGPFYQSKFHISEGQPDFAWRFQLCVSVPTGQLNQHDNLNQGSGFWAVNPLLAVTWLPRPRIELSVRLNYQYNFRTSTIQNPPPIPGLVYRNGQAGQLVYGNLAVSYAVIPNAYLGFNGYALAQLTPDRTNGSAVANSRETEAAAGPGGRYVFDPANALNVNLYMPVVARNASSGTQLGFQFVHRF